MDEKSEMHVEIKKPKKEKLLTRPILLMVALVVGVLIFNQFQINSITGMVVAPSGVSSSAKDISNLDINSLQSTGHTLAAVFPVEDIVTSEDALAMLFPTGTPDYGEQLGVSYDDPVESLGKLAAMYRGLKADVQQNDPAAWDRFMNLASKPVGISCEYCCGLGPVGIDQNGNSACGCQHNPALLSVALYLTAYTDYTDAEILKESIKWKTLFFPKDMIKLGMSVAGGDTSALDNLPGMVGGC